jgi:hypothetical protein
MILVPVIRTDDVVFGCHLLSGCRSSALLADDCIKYIIHRSSFSSSVSLPEELIDSSSFHSGSEDRTPLTMTANQLLPFDILPNLPVGRPLQKT